MNKDVIISTIVENDLCTGCGACVSESSNSLKMKWDEFGFLIPEQIADSSNDLSIRVCPFNPSPEKEVRDEDKLAKIFLKETPHQDFRIGSFVNTYAGFANEYRETSSSGGIATYIFEKLLKDRIVDHLYIVKEVNGSYAYQLFSEPGRIIESSKTRYIPVTLEDLFKSVDSIEGTVAVSGVACFVKAIRLKQHYHPELKAKIPFVVGIICGGLKSTFFTDYLSQRAGIIGSYSKQEYRIKDARSLSSDYSFGAFDSKSKFHKLKMRTVGDMWGSGLFKANACDFCNDVTTELADISLGDAWLNEFKKEGLGNSVIITRSILADQIIKEGISKKDLSVRPLDLDKVIESQRGSFTHRQDTLKFRVDLFKKKHNIVPQQRERFFKDGSLSLYIVQYFRRRTRSKSLTLWRELRSAMKFDKAMKKHFLALRIVTKINHKLRR